MDAIENKNKLRVDFHCHSLYSRDSLTKPETLVKICLQKRLDRIVITDHNTIQGALEAYRLDPTHVIVGEEIMTASGEILAAYVKEYVPAGLSPQKTIQILRDQDAFISISHPFDHMRKGSWNKGDLLAILPMVDAIEGFNARSMVPDANQKAMLFANEHGLAMTAGSDAHAAFEMGMATICLEPFENVDELKKNIGKGTMSAKQSPWWVHILSLYAKYHKTHSKG
ncbi:MAG: hypothetical protein A2X25_12665 [Chloroflexi bacterium GWB2_49_20]|nr:MAG: hypothetical protein A2X25_12665 [Chloroflexi bacterium GWB2_49_20]OGN78429.1 MAG: hypothetical protein A2X26_01535 [Chloroflexi bacterium GWC2_49_37]OGN84108.1 MAG: hypothetical protein A2X27_14150 [Chloroflexi bacterium GWD2_49_16]